MCKIKKVSTIYRIFYHSYEFCFIVSETAFRKCGEGGIWNGKFPNDGRENGWTNFTDCFSPDLMRIKKKLFNEKVDPTVHIYLWCFALKMT